MLFGSKASSYSLHYVSEPINNTDQEHGSTKNREARQKSKPTPKRRDAQKRNERPLVVGNRKLTKEEKAERKKKRNEVLNKQRLAMDGKAPERYLPERDQGPLRKATRDMIDTRWTLSEFLVPIMFVAFIATFFLPRGGKLAFIPLGIIYAIFFSAMLEMFITNRQIKSKLAELFPGRPIPAGQGMYVASRMMQLRPWRQPKPGIKRGESIR